MEARPLEIGAGPLVVAREVLDRFAVGARLQHVRQFIWRGGMFRLEVSESGTELAYVLVARWSDALLERVDTAALAPLAALVPASGAVLDGRWIRGETGYMLRAGIDLAVPSAIAIRSDRHASFVPFCGRPPAEVERALDADLAAYVQHFLATCLTVPQATAAGAARLKHLGL
jgi:hypothetical protein